MIQFLQLVQQFNLKFILVDFIRKTIETAIMTAPRPVTMSLFAQKLSDYYTDFILSNKFPFTNKNFFESISVGFENFQSNMTT